jgi:hypothetical protein
MANEEQLSILKQGVDAWHKWKREDAEHWYYDLSQSNLRGANLDSADLSLVDLTGANLSQAQLWRTNLSGSDLTEANLGDARLTNAILTGTILKKTNFRAAIIGNTVFGDVDFSEAIGLTEVVHRGPSHISTNAISKSKGKIPIGFLLGCGLSDIEIEFSKLSNPDLTNEEINGILYKIYDLRAIQTIQISPLYISYSHADHSFVEKIEVHLNEKGIRFWRDIHELTAGRMEKQFDRAMRQNPTVLLILSANSIKSDWVEHEVRTARELEKEMGRDVLCPVALDDSWKDSSWPKRVMEQIMEYNILDFSAWEDDSKFDSMFRKLIDGLELFYKG